MTSSPEQLPNAGVFKRIAAMFYDTMLLIGVLAGAAIIPLVLLTPEKNSHNTGEVIHQIDTIPMLSGIGFKLYLLAIIAIFFTAFWSKSGQTLGMQAWKIRIENPDGSKPSIKQCLIRVMTATLSFACLGLGYWWQWIDKEGLNWQDRTSKTRVVQIPKR